jgi:hypothetical protein
MNISNYGDERTLTPVSCGEAAVKDCMAADIKELHRIISNTLGTLDDVARVMLGTEPYPDGDVKPSTNCMWTELKLLINEAMGVNELAHKIQRDLY